MKLMLLMLVSNFFLCNICFSEGNSKAQSSQMTDLDVFMSKHNLKMEEQKEYFHLRVDKRAKQAEIFYLHYVSSQVICVAGSDFYAYESTEGSKPFLQKKYISISDRVTDLKGCAEKPINEYFVVESGFSDGTLLKVHQYIKEFLLVEKPRTYNQLYSIGLERTETNAIIYNAKFIRSGDDDLGLSLSFDFVGGEIRQLKKYTYSVE